MQEDFKPVQMSTERVVMSKLQKCSPYAGKNVQLDGLALGKFWYIVKQETVLHHIMNYFQIGIFL